MKTTVPTGPKAQDVESGPRKRRGGGQPGNRNALKHGRYTREKRALRKRIAQWRRTTRALIAQARRELARRGQFLSSS